MTPPSIAYPVASGMTWRSPARTRAIHRFAIWSVLLLFSVFFLLPLYVMLATSLKDMAEVRDGSLLSVPKRPSLDAWHKAWSQACTGTDCGGLRPFFWNSTLMVVPAVVISTALGAVNGYVFAKWRFRGSELMFGMMLFGAFMPLQVVLLPMSQVLGWFQLSDSIWGLVIVHVLVGLATTTLFFRNYYVSLPDELVRAAMLDGAGFWRIFWRIVLPLSPPILIVTVIWQFTGIWNEFLYGVTFTTGGQQPVTAALIAIATTPATDLVEYGIQSAAVLLAALPTLLIYFFGGRYFMRGLTAGAIK